MIRATTPTHTLIFPFDVLQECKKVLITYMQNGKIILEKKINDLESLGDNKFSYRLSQEETKKFDTSSSVEIQVRVLTLSDEAMASKIMRISVQKVLNDEVL